LVLFFKKEPLSLPLAFDLRACRTKDAVGTRIESAQLWQASTFVFLVPSWLILLSCYGQPPVRHASPAIFGLE
jgi:hypothetical protein